MGVKRYECFAHEGMTEDAAGSYVRLDDYQSEKARAELYKEADESMQEEVGRLHALLYDEKVRADAAEADARRWKQVAPFVAAVMDEWWEGDLDGGQRQDLAERHGLIVGAEATEPCCDDCHCEEYGLPTICYKRTDLLRAAIGATHD